MKARAVVKIMIQVKASEKWKVARRPSTYKFNKFDSINACIYFTESALLARADEVIDRLRRVRRGCQAEELRKSGKGKKRIADEIGTLFPHQKKGKPVKKTSSWTHRFVCLAMCDQDGIPTTSSEKDRLICAGLGEKKIFF